MSNFPRKRGGQPKNTSALRHGGGAAVQAIQDGKPLTGPARQAELAVYEELETQGRFSLVKRNAARLQAAADLYWGAISKLVETAGEGMPPDMLIIKLDKYVKRFGWLAGASLRAWAQVKEEERDEVDALVADYEEIIGESGTVT